MARPCARNIPDAWTPIRRSGFTAGRKRSGTWPRSRPRRTASSISTNASRTRSFRGARIRANRGSRSVNCSIFPRPRAGLRLAGERIRRSRPGRAPPPDGGRAGAGVHLRSERAPGFPSGPERKAARQERRPIISSAGFCAGCGSGRNVTSTIARATRSSPPASLLTARQWARMGQLVLDQGKPVVRPESLAQCWRGSPANRAFSLGWWNNRAAPGGREFDFEDMLIPKWSRQDWHDACLCRDAPRDLVASIGSRYQRLYVIPSLDLIVVRQGRGRAILGRALPPPPAREVRQRRVNPGNQESRESAPIYPVSWLPDLFDRIARPLWRSGGEREKFHQGNTSGSVRALHNRGVAEAAGTGRQRRDDGRFQITGRRHRARDDLRFLGITPIVVRGEQGPVAVVQFQGRILERTRHACARLTTDRSRARSLFAGQSRPR